ncbi:hypothetical protein LCM4573_15150 [Rhizobium sp. LCM 4573]|nr:hypothetical protein LCM4573_15150 [Rhizobium sp. LCM 4573]
MYAEGIVNKLAALHTKEPFFFGQGNQSEALSLDALTIASGIIFLKIYRWRFISPRYIQMNISSKQGEGICI